MDIEDYVWSDGADQTDNAPFQVQNVQFSYDVEAWIISKLHFVRVNYDLTVPDPDVLHIVRHTFFDDSDEPIITPHEIQIDETKDPSVFNVKGRIEFRRLRGRCTPHVRLLVEVLDEEMKKTFFKQSYVFGIPESSR